MYKFQLAEETLCYQQLPIFIQHISSFSCEQSKLITFTNSMGSRMMVSEKILSFRWHVYCKYINSASQLCQIKSIHAEVLAGSSCRVLKKSFNLHKCMEKKKL